MRRGPRPTIESSAPPDRCAGTRRYPDRERKGPVSTQLGFDLTGLTAAIERGDPDYQLALYAADAALEVNDSDPRLPPRVYVGRSAIRGWIEQITSRQLTHHLENLSSSGDCVELTDHIRHPDGRNVVYQISARVAHGQISSQTVTPTWEDVADQT
jgi:ketosteroid isomerase-like protein